MTSDLLVQPLAHDLAEELRVRNLRSARLTAFLAAALLPPGITLDWLNDAPIVPEFAAVRISAAGACLLVGLDLYDRGGERWRETPRDDSRAYGEQRPCTSGQRDSGRSSARARRQRAERSLASAGDADAPGAPLLARERRAFFAARAQESDRGGDDIDRLGT